MIQCKRKNDLTVIITICGQPVSLDYIHRNDKVHEQVGSPTKAQGLNKMDFEVDKGSKPQNPKTILLPGRVG